MNYIFVDIKVQEEKFKIVNRTINEKIEVKEIYFSKEKIEEIILLKRKKEKNIFKRYINTCKINKFEKGLLKAIKELYNSEEKVYLFSKQLLIQTETTRYIRDIFGKENIKEYRYKGEYEKNIPEHIKEYCLNKISKSIINSKVLIIYKDLDNMHQEMLQKIIDNHKTVNILALEDVSSYQVKKIKKINEINGTTISIINKNKKAFKEYDIALFMDTTYEETKRYRFAKEALKIYLLNIEKDNLDTNYLYTKDLIDKSKVLESILEKLEETYGQNTVASIIAKLHKTIDKS